MREAQTKKRPEPISLYPLKPSEAIRGLLAVKPEPKAKAEKRRKKTSKPKH